ncbi:MFS transporter [Ruminococcus sp. OA3]|uniref:MFS transporter n=1 Tax=Ruminococcus sp. OA3 TaxID=2914164 RepID=UPI001F051ACD|nr:MFS transporter [Ruminococcus sp. OA3]MCH1981992.1 MFS transporter [Ruminococcus sp. OA3]
MKNKLFTKNFTLLVAGQASSLFGNCILDFAMSMYVLEVTGSAAVFAGFLAAAMLPAILLSPLAGVLADRANKRSIMVALDFISGVVTLLAALMMGRVSDLTVICTALIALSVLGTFESPTVQACIPQMQTGDNIVRGNAVVNQIAAVSTLAAPFIGSMLYSSFGLKPVMYAGVICFFITSIFEYFIRLDYIPQQTNGHILQIVKHDLKASTHFISRVRPSILKTLLLVSVTAFFVQGVALVGLPFIIRSVLGLSASYYGAAESILGFAGLAGSVIAGLAAARFRTGNLNLPILCIGLFLLPAGLIFYIPIGTFPRYVTLIAFFALIQIAACVFSIFCLSIIQQLTPERMIGKVMAYTATISLCAQPLGQIIYGILFDVFSNNIYFVLLPSAVILCVTGLAAKHFFRKTEEQLKQH